MSRFRQSSFSIDARVRFRPRREVWRPLDDAEGDLRPRPQPGEHETEATPPTGSGEGG